MHVCTCKMPLLSPNTLTCVAALKHRLELVVPTFGSVRLRLYVCVHSHTHTDTYTCAQSFECSNNKVTHIAGRSRHIRNSYLPILVVLYA